MNMHFSKKSDLQWAATHSHPFDVKITRTRWPLFYSTAFFLPKFKLKIVNKGSAIDKCDIQVDVSAYDGPIGSATTHREGWVDAYHHNWVRPWEAGGKRSLVVKIPGRNLPRPGTYIVRFTVNKWNPQGAPYKEVSDALEKVKDMPQTNKKEALEFSVEQMKRMGIDPYRPTGSFTGEVVFTGTIIDYFRIEPVSNVMNFWIVVGTFVTATATLVVGIATLLVSHGSNVDASNLPNK